MKERATIVFIAVILGLLLTTVVFFIYQSTKVLPKDIEKSKNASKDATPTKSENNLYVVVDEPKNESITDKRIVEVKGKTNSDNLLIISSNQEDQVISPTSTGQFSASITIDAGTNKIVTHAISPSGEETTDMRIVSYTTEEF